MTPTPMLAMLRPPITAMLRPTPLRSLVRRSASGHHQLPPGSRRSFASGGGKAPDFDNMGASELRALVKELWRKSPQGSISAPSEVSRVTKGAALDAEKEQDSFKAMTIVELQKMRDQNIPISMVTAYDFPSVLVYAWMAACMPARMRAIPRNVQGLIGKDNAHVLLRCVRAAYAQPHPYITPIAPPPLLASRMHTPAHPRSRTFTLPHTHTMK